ncbi:hypothetical protein [Paraburkholderia fungorum]|jgi:hypothetical protein|uniref:Uncharacterized protein n=1 Tax=Paraburkholderia fungorum TaxID=134537 RepID=A0AAP5Q5R6_9BURK|nr:hypothetical protein [Paraburkholderia fungorum]MDT8837633.1 hypothetical protein [Paraburkholderia fungorum]PRZ47742.1 hypothetical protein BX589_12972 [Paraburkholderia fungorum]USU16225.1 hypothetical protein NFE55_00030 [Paraburkholderia fungorum]USU24169.1 hypothetical protein NFS19_00030 [Paraburkholderia fungorum]
MPLTPDFLSYDEPLIAACEDVLKKHWHRGRSLKLTRKPKKGTVGTFYCLIDPQYTKSVLIEDRANEKLPLPVVAIHPFVVTDSFYFGIRLRFDHVYESTFMLTSVSVSLFTGNKLAPIVRAEWDYRDIGKSRHAQPHWHLLGLALFDSLRDSFETGQTGDNEPRDFNSAQTLPRAEIERIHFATSAAWQAGSPTAIQHLFLKKEQLINWLGGLAEYMSEQLTVVASKSAVLPANASPPVKDFQPGR